jgi:hypothetical protein
MNSSRVLQPSVETSASLNNLANHDLKALSYVALHEVGETTGSGLGTAVANHIGDSTLRGPVLAYPVTYHAADFADVRTGIGGNGRASSFYSATHQESALAPIGSMLRWSEIYDMPLVTTLSTTSSKGESRAPLNTIQIFDGLLKGLSIAAMDLPGYKPTEAGWDTAHNTRLLSLVKSGIVIAEDEPVTFRILDPAYKGSMPFEQQSPTIQAIYNTLSIASQSDSQREWSTIELEAIADQHALITDESRDKFNFSLIRVVSSNTPTYSPGAVEKQLISGRTYRLNGKYAGMIANLVEQVVQIDASARYRTKARNYAVDAYRDSAAAGRIAARGMINSPHRKLDRSIPDHEKPLV